MKKLYALMLTVVMLTALTMSAFAAASPKAVAQESVKAVTIAAEDATVKEASAQVVRDALGLAEAEEHMTNLGVPEGARVAAVLEVSYSGEIPAGGVKIPFVISNANVGDYVVLLHRSSTPPYQWEVVGRGVLGADKTIVGTFTSFSPVVVMVVDADDFVAAGVKAPKTGQ